MGSRMASAAGKALKAGAVVGVAAVGATVGAALVGGFKSAVAQQGIEATMTGLYGSAGKAVGTLKQIKDLSKTSPIDYKAYGDAANSLAYAGVEGKGAVKILDQVGWAITGAGGGATELDRAMQGLLKGVNNGGVVMNDTLGMISDSGYPIIDGLAAKFGKSGDEIKKMAADGKLSVEDVIDVMQNKYGPLVGKQIDGGKEKAKTFGDTWLRVKDNIGLALGEQLIPLLEKAQPFLEKLGQAVVSGIEKLPGIISTVVAAFKEWAPVLGTVVAGFAAYRLILLGITIGTAAYNAVLVAQKFATAGAAVQMRILNAAMRANPIGLIITAITLLVAGFILMYKKVGWFRDGVNAAWAGIKVAVAAVANWFKTVLWPTMQAVWNGIMVAVRAVVSWFQSYVAPVVKAVFAGVGAVFSWLWKSIIVPVFNGIKLVITTWWAGVKIIFNAVMNFIKAYLVPVFQLFWAIIKVVWAGIKAAINSVWQFIKKYVFTPIVNFVNNQLVPRFKFLQAVMKLVWVKIQYHIRTAWAFIEKYIFQPIVNWINVHLAPKFKWLKSVIATAWGNIKSNISKVWNFIRDKVFSPLKNAITKSVPDAFEKGKDAIGKAWDKVRDVAKKPVKFVVETIINKGIIGNFNKIAKTFGVDEMPDVKLPKGFATGGYTGTGGKYSPAGVVHADEYVLRKEAQNKISRTHGRSFLDHMNRTGDVPGYAKGGKVKGNLIDAANWWIAKGARGSRHPAFGGAVRSGHSRGSMHYQDKAVDLNYGPGGQNATEMSFFDKHVAQFKKLFTGIRVIWRAAGHFNHMHIDTSNGADMGDFSGAMSGGGGDISSFLNPFSGLIDKVKAGVGDSPFGKMIGEGAKKAISWPIDWLKSKAGMIGDVVENVKDVVTTGAGRARGKKWAVAQGWPLIGGARWKALDYIVSRESSWNPKAQNPSSTASGLGQFINSTSRAYMGGSPMKKYPFDDQLKGVIKYTDDRYGGLGKAMAFWKSHNYYAKGTKNASRGWATVGEQGPELIKLRGGEQIKSNRASQRFVDSNQDAAKPVFHVEFHGRVDDPNEVVSKLQFEMNRFYSGGRYAR